MQERITELEVKVAFQEHQLSELDGVIQTLRHELDGLRRDVQEIREQGEDSESADPHQPPPHY
ncbi:MAG: hypothetical protein GWP91_08095 [Rhodobacterales bacterium]|nr:hypothetical protein [Rhodobacterales bacterium]